MEIHSKMSPVENTNEMRPILNSTEMENSEDYEVEFISYEVFQRIVEEAIMARQLLANVGFRFVNSVEHVLSLRERNVEEFHIQ